MTATMLRRSLTSIGSATLQALASSLIRGGNLTIVTIGGSVAKGLMVPLTKHVTMKRTNPSTERFAAWLSRRYPQARIRYHNLAVPGSTSAWRTLEMEDIAKLAPDLILWDYSANDIFDSSNAAYELRVVLERLARQLLSLPSKPAVIYLGGLRNVSKSEAATYHLQAEAAEPVVRRYGLGMVSYRDAFWPSVDDFSHSTLYKTFPNSGAPYHPAPDVHRLIADCLSYFWCTIEELVWHERKRIGRLRIDDGQNDLPPAAFMQDSADALAPCEGGWKTVVRFHRNGDGDVLDPGVHSIHEIGPGWTYRQERVTKEGWEFTINRKDSEPPTKEVKLADGRRAQVHEPIAFRMRFGERPRLIVSYLRSYANFGRALVWFDDQLPEALRRVHVNECYTAMCIQNAFHSKDTASARHLRPKDWCGDNPRDSEYFGWTKQTGSKPFAFLPMLSKCEPFLTGQQPPFVLDGWWSDQSSQIHSRGFDRGFLLTPDSAASGTTVFMEDRTVPLVPSASQGPRSGSGIEHSSDEHVVRIAMLTEPSVLATMEGLHASNRSHFKVMSIRSC